MRFLIDCYKITPNQYFEAACCLEILGCRRRTQILQINKFVILNARPHTRHFEGVRVIFLGLNHCQEVRDIIKV
jgi:hypothetical protein